jgi:hypothetical protein
LQTRSGNRSLVEVLLAAEVQDQRKSEPDPRWSAYYAEASRRRRARGWHRRRHDPKVSNQWAQRKLMLIVCILGVVGVVVAVLVS